MQETLAKLREEFVTKANNFEADFKKFSKEQHRNAKRKGVRDASQVTMDEPLNSLTPHEKSILSAFAGQIAELAVDFSGMLEKVKKDFINTIDEDLSTLRMRGVSSEVKYLRQRCSTELEKLEDEYHEELEMINDEPTLKKLKSELDDVDDNLDEMSDTLGRRVGNEIIKVNGFVYFLILLAIGLAEVTATYNSFLNFEEPPWSTWAWAVSVGLVLAVIAHFAGSFFAVGREKKSYFILGAVISVATLGMLYYISMVRAGGMEEIIVKHLSFQAFMTISSIIFIAGILLAFMAHDSNPQFSRLLKQREKLKRAVDAKERSLYNRKKELHDKLQRSEHAVNIKYNAEIEKKEGAEEKLRHQKHDAITLHDEMLQGLKNLEIMMIYHMNGCLEEYRSAFSEHCKLKDPEYWKNQIHMPLSFQNQPLFDEITKNKGLWHYSPN
jgi:tetrahydromethanopterin S-methyltransferase subunit G